MDVNGSSSILPLIKKRGCNGLKFICDRLSALNELVELARNRVGYEAGAAPRRERNVSPAGELSAPHCVASACQGKPRLASRSPLGPFAPFFPPPWTKSTNGPGVIMRTVSTGYPPKITNSLPIRHHPLRLSSLHGTALSLLGLTDLPADTPSWLLDKQPEKLHFSASSLTPVILPRPPLRTSLHPSPSLSKVVLAIPLTSAQSRSTLNWTPWITLSINPSPSHLRIPRPLMSGTR